MNRQRSAMGGMVLSVVGLLECILGNGKLNAKLVINPLVNGLRLVHVYMYIPVHVY